MIPPALRRKRFLIPALVAATVGAFLVRELWRGAVPGGEPAFPAPGAPASVGLVSAPEGPPVLVARAVVPASLPPVWEVITDYAAFPRLFPMLESLTTRPGPDGAVHLSGTVHGLGWSFPLEVDVRHRPGAQRATVEWDSPTPQLPTNRGSWTLEAGEGGTRVTYRLAVEVAGLPDALIRAALRDVSAVRLAALGDEVQARLGARAASRAP